MNKSAIKNFSIEARKLLIKMAVTEAGSYDITKDRCGAPIQKGTDFEVYRTIAGTENRIFGDIIKKRANLVKAISEHGFESVMEAAAYTWFNRLIAVRFMEVNDYLPSRVRVLSSETGSSTPDVVTKSLDVDLNMNANEVAAVQKAKADNKYDEAFRLLFIKQCNELNKILPGLFETTDDYMELLLKLSYTNDGVVRMLVDTVLEEDFDVSKEGQVEIIGWMYQYYNTELKDETFALLKKNVKITKERIPAATQLFTPDWIVRYMVENSLGRFWIEHLRADDDLVDEKATAEQFGWKYYLPEAKQEDSVNVKLAEVRKSYKEMSPLDIKCIDPCMGSGHILVYMFDVLMDIYRSAGYSERDAAFYILENNISGLDIDQRAYQLSYFALMMKGRGYNRRFFAGREMEQEGKTCRQYPSPEVRAIEESNELPSDIINQIKMNFPDVFNDRELHCISYVVNTFKDAKEYGSILNVDAEPDNEERQYASVALKLFSLIDNSHMFCLEQDLNILQRLLITEEFLLIHKLLTQACVMSRKYDVVVTNPPYMGNMPYMLGSYVIKHYETVKYDLYSAFIERCMDYTKINGLYSLVTQHTFMFIASYEKYRNLLLKRNMVNLIHLGAKAFPEIGGEVVQSVAFCFRKSQISNYISTFNRLLEGDSDTKRDMLLKRNNHFEKKINDFSIIPGNTFAYWLSDEFLESFNNIKIGDITISKAGIVSGNDKEFLKLWYEICKDNITFDATDWNQENKIKWVPINKGGSYRQFYGNNEYVINLYDLWYSDKVNASVRRSEPEYYFKPGIIWSYVNTGRTSFRFTEKKVSATAAPCLFFNDETMMYYTLGFLSSNIAQLYLDVINPTFNLNTGNVSSLPIIYNKEKSDMVVQLVKKCIEIEEIDWNLKETSWEFDTHPFVKIKNASASDNFETMSDFYIEQSIHRYQYVKDAMNELDNIFIDVYRFDSTYIEKNQEKDIPINIPSKYDCATSLLSYIVGCLFGRYDYESAGLQFAGGKTEKFSKFVDKDNIIPITDDEYFDDDIVSKVIAFITTVWGERYLEDNLNFLTRELGIKGKNGKECLRYYFINYFFKNHCSLYNSQGAGKRPIYWLFDSGNQNGFKALIYMHRYDKDTVGRIRSDYLHKTQNAIEGALKNAEYIISTSSSAIDKAKATKDRDRYIKQLSETRIYDQALAHVALQRIDIDLDDGVKHNYELFQGIEVASEGAKKQTIDLLAKL